MSSKWSYIGVGLNVGAAIIGATIHNLLLILISVGVVTWGWYVAEHQREQEDQELLFQYEESKKEEQDKTNVG